MSKYRTTTKQIVEYIDDDPRLFKNSTSIHLTKLINVKLSDLEGFTDIKNLNKLYIDNNSIDNIDVLKTLYLEGSFKDQGFIYFKNNNLSTRSTVVEDIEFLKNNGVTVLTE